LQTSLQKININIKKSPPKSLLNLFVQAKNNVELCYNKIVIDNESLKVLEERNGYIYADDTAIFTN